MRSPVSKRAARRSGLALLATVGLFLSGSTAAEAVASSSSIAYTNGTRAAEAFFNHRVPGTHGNRAWIDIYDAKCDGYPVFVRYSVFRPGSGVIANRKYHHDGGCGTTVGFNLTWNNGDLVRYQGCVRVSWGDDVCGPLREERLP